MAACFFGGEDNWRTDYLSVFFIFIYIAFICGWDSSALTNEYNTDEINNWYGTCCCSASFFMRSNI